MHFHLTIATAAVLLLGSSPLIGQARQSRITVISGTLLGADGTPMRLARAQLYAPYRPFEAATAVVGRDGHFAIATVADGPMILRLSGVDHDAVLVPLFLSGASAITLDVRLKHYAYTDSLDRVEAIGDWSNFTRSATKPLVRQADGRYTLDVETSADTIMFQLVGLEAKGRLIINAPGSPSYVYDDAGGYRSVVRADNGHATIVLDPTQLDRRPSALSVTFRDAQSRAARLYALNIDLDQQRADYLDSARAAYQRHTTPHYNWPPIVAGRTAALARERDAVARGFLMMQLLDAAQSGASLDRTIGRDIVRELRPSSPLWQYTSWAPQMMYGAFAAVAGDTGEGVDTAASLATLAYIDSVVGEQPDSGVQQIALAGEWNIVRSLKDDRRTQMLLQRLVTDYPYSPLTAFVKSRLASHVWHKGEDVPAFRFVALDDSSVVYTPASFAGKVYLLDFWATWCGPCVHDMKYLQAAYDSLAPRGLQILSISLDQTPADVRIFRRGTWKLPWFNAYVPGGFGDLQMRQLEIVMLPRYVLVGRDGKVIALDSEIRGEDLMPALRRALAMPPAP